MALNGWIILDKPVGLGSTQAVGAVKRVMRQAGQPKAKVGHGGTLDPLASGVLPIAIGEATKLVGRVLDAVKAYDFTIRFGEETDTLDLEGRVVATSDVRPSREEIEQIHSRFTGSILQTPPAYSALKVDGRRAYDLARAGEAPQLEARQVTVHELKAGETGPDEATLSTIVSKGTYIRSLARDIAHGLGAIGHLTMLRRTRADPFTLDQAVSIDHLNSLTGSGDLEQAVLPLAAGLGDIPRLSVNAEEARRLRMGQRLVGHSQKSGTYLAIEGELPIALVELDGGGISVLRGFNL
jgi:tRNA pseudouridine55 synthase